MSTDLTDCKIHVEQQLPSHIYIDRFYELSIYLKHNAVPKFLNEEDKVQVITSIITADTKQTLHSPHFLFENPSPFKRSGDTSTKFKITALSNQFERYRIQCEIRDSPVTEWISSPFTVVEYKLGMTKELQLIDGDKWYKDEGGKTNFLSFEMGLHENYNNIDRLIQLNRDITFKLELVYFDDKSVVLNQSILRIDGDQEYILSSLSGKVEVRFKIDQVSSHHQRRRFSLKVIPINDKTIGPCFSKAILVLSKRNRPKKTAHLMSPQKRKEVATKKKIKRKRSQHKHIKDEAPHKKRKLMTTDDDDDDDDIELDNDNNCNNDNVYSSLREYEMNPDKYFDYNSKQMKYNLVRCLRLCCDTFCVLSGRPQYHPYYGFGEENTNQIIYYCSFCKRFARDKPSLINHYERCRILEVIELLRGERSTMSSSNMDSLESSANTSNPIPLDCGVEYNYNKRKEEKTNININSNLEANAMINAMLINNNNNSNVGANNFAAALNEILQNATNNNDNNKRAFMFNNNAKPNHFAQLFEMGHKK